MYQSYETAPPQQKTERKREEPKPEEPQPLQKPVEKEETDQPSLLDTLLKDNERSLILILLLILYSDGADSTLLLALMYLII